MAVVDLKNRYPEFLKSNRWGEINRRARRNPARHDARNWQNGGFRNAGRTLLTGSCEPDIRSRALAQSPELQADFDALSAPKRPGS